MSAPFGRGLPAPFEGTYQRTDDAALYRTVRFLRAYMDHVGLAILYNGALKDIKAPAQADSPANLTAYLHRKRFDHKRLIDHFTFALKEVRQKVSIDEARRALSLIVEEDRDRRYEEVVDRLLRPATFDRAEADAEWDKAALLFEDEAEITRAFLKNQLYQVKVKLAGMKPKYHTMLVIVAGQGAGKTTFVDKLLRSVLEELVPPPARFSDFIDARSSMIYMFAALIFDDLHRIEPKHIGDLKQIMSAPDVARRRMRSNELGIHDQLTTLFATSNLPIEQIISDLSGMRRFVQLTMRNGQTVTGGDAEIWKTVNELNYKLLWDSIDTWGPCPIDEHLHHLFADRPRKDPLRNWLIALDLNSDDVLNLLEPKGIRSEALLTLFKQQTGIEMTANAFGRRMSELAFDPEVPFGPAEKHGWNFYPLKPEFKQP